MHGYVVLFAALAVAMGSVHADAWKKPRFCNLNDCPVFSVLEQGQGYERRQYPEAQWVSTSYVANSPAEADGKQSKAFNKLFQYISGANVNGEKIAMTCPVLIEILPGPGPNCNSAFTMSFYLPYSRQQDAPAPSADDVFLQKYGDLEVYVRSFGGYASNADHLKATIELAELVGEDQVEVTSYFTAGYDSPFKWWNRHNESWMKVKKN